MSSNGFEVPPLSRAAIRQEACRIRDMLQLHEPYFPIVDLYEFALPNLIEGFELQIASNDEMGHDHGLTYPERNLIVIREDVYDRACEGYGRDRATLAHELGHLMLHSNIALARTSARAGLPRYQNSEWQADCFAGELLVDHRLIHWFDSPTAVSQACGVSMDAANTQWRANGRN